MHRDVATAIDFPDYYGHNLDALNDCLRDVESLQVRTHKGCEWPDHCRPRLRPPRPRRTACGAPS
ncbi:barstar family protein [Streptomyces sp. NPDC059582]|uniref:barstar family protein n=1 Tax=Streptomyces sp. NPDC059582 TaxID=3346875 RepID=UPI0036D051E7